MNDDHGDVGDEVLPPRIANLLADGSVWANPPAGLWQGVMDAIENETRPESDEKRG